MAVRHAPLIRSLEDANRVAQKGMLYGAFLGAAFSYPVATSATLLGSWLDERDPSMGFILGITVLVTGGFVGAFWRGQHDLMRDWPALCRAVVWVAWRRGLAVAVPLGLPVAALFGWLAWRSEHSWSLSLGIGLEVSGWFALVGVGVGCYRGERSVQQVLQQAGYIRFGWFQYGATTAFTRPLAEFTAGASTEEGIQGIREEVQRGE